MGKGKKRPWIQAKIAAAQEGGGGKEAAVLAEAERRKKQKAADRAARERAFKEQNPERFEKDGEDDEGGFGGGETNAGDGGGGADATADGWSARDGNAGNAASRGGTNAVAPEAYPPPPGGYAKPPRDRPPPPPWRDDERTDVSTVPDVEKWMRSKEARLPEAAKEQRRSRAEAITRQIAAAAQHKQLGKAVNHYRRLVKHERLIPTSYTYASLLNAYVNSGDMRGAEEILRRMKAVPGMSPNVVVYTTMLKGHMLSGDVDKAEALINEMPKQKPPVALDARAVNTFLRVCQRAGDAPRAWEAYRKMKGSGPASAPCWTSVVPDDATYKLVARLLSQSLSARDVKDVIADAAAHAARDRSARATSGGDASAAPCQFWNAGRCDRGAACVFFHDPEKTQRADVETADAVASMHVNLAHCAALLDDAEAARLAIETANNALDEAEALASKLGEPGAVAGDPDAEETQTRGQNVDIKAATLAGALVDSSATATYKRTTRAELRLELKRVGGFLKRVRKGAQEKPDVAEYLTRALVFDSRVEVCGDGVPGAPGAEKNEAPDVDALVSTLHGRLCDAYGLERACAVSAKVTAESAKKRLRSVLGDDGRVDFATLFSRHSDSGEPSRAESVPATITAPDKKDKKSKKDKKDKKDKRDQERRSSEPSAPGAAPENARPVKLEICAGNGDWAVAQARADPDSDWVALELRHDRVYSIFSRAVCEGAPNLCAMGGDAASVLRKHVRPGSVSHVFVNFPEPPHHSGDAAAVNEFHLLTPGFFRRTHRALAAGGGLTLFSDNHRYMRDLARTLAELTYEPQRGDDPAKAGEPLFAAEAAKPRAEARDDARAISDADASFENIEGVRLYRGVPGEGTGHLVHEQSYFDRFWEQGARTERFFAVVSKN